MTTDIEFFPDEEISEQPKTGIFQPSLERKTERGIARTGARVFETTFGSLGDIVQSAEGLMKSGLEKATGKELPGLDLTKNLLHLPTTEQIKEMEQGLLGQYLEPQNKLEKFGDDFTETATSLLLLKVPAAQAAKGALLGTGLKHTGKALGAPEWVQTGLDMLGVTLGSTKFPNINKYKNALYEATKQSLGKTELIDTTKLASELDPILEKLSKGSQKIPQKNKVRELIAEVQEKAQTGAMDVSDLWQHKIDHYKALGDYQNVGPYKENLKMANKVIKNTLYSHGKQNPEFVKNLKRADKFFGEAADFDKAGGFIKEVKQAEKFGAATALVFGEVKKLAKILGISSVGRGIYNLLKHPRIVELYAKSLGSGLKQNKAGVINNMRRLDKEIKNISEEEIQFVPD